MQSTGLDGLKFLMDRNFHKQKDLIGLLNLSETIDLLAEAGVKGNIRSSDVFASLNSIFPQDL